MKYSLMIHGGAGLIKDDTGVLEGIKRIMVVGEERLLAGESALDVVEGCVSLLENDEHFNAGRGAVLNSEGKVELDALIIDGTNLEAGAVAGVKNIKNPITLARKVMEESEHVFLIGEGAMVFAKQVGVELESEDYFIIENRKLQWEEAKKAGKVVLDHSDLSDKGLEKKYGTVGAVAMDMKGNLASATSTGGIVNKKFGRVGDTPVVGAGGFADNESCAVSATGYGEQMLRFSLAKTISDIIIYEKVEAQEAADKAMALFVKKVNGLGGVIVIDRFGNCGVSYSTKGIIYGQVQQGQEIIVALK